MSKRRGRLSRKEREEMKRLALKLLEKPHTGKALCIAVGLTPAQSVWFHRWRGKNKPLILHLTIPQVEKLGISVVGLDEYSEEMGKRIPLFFHPNQKNLWKLLKPYEKKTVFNTPTAEGLEVEGKILNLRKNSQTSVEKEIQKIKGIELTLHCPKCGHRIVLRGTKE